MGIDLRSPAFDDGGTIPDRYGRSGDGVSPPLEWSGVPEGTRELALVVEDPDAPRGTFVHWVVAGLAPDLTRLDEGGLPPSAVEGRNDFGDVGWDGPQPPKGAGAHRYVFSLLALREPSGLRPGDDARRFHDATRGKEVARGRLTGRFAR